MICLRWLRYRLTSTLWNISGKPPRMVEGWPLLRKAGTRLQRLLSGISRPRIRDRLYPPVTSKDRSDRRHPGRTCIGPEWRGIRHKRGVYAGEPEYQVHTMGIEHICKAVSINRYQVRREFSRYNYMILEEK